MIVNCVACGKEWEREAKRGRPHTKCPDCRQINIDLTMATAPVTETVDGIVWVENSEPCTVCTKTFMRPKKKGRPPTKCPDCLSTDSAAKAAEVTVSEERLEQLFSGDQALLKGNPRHIPKGAEAQCPAPNGCGRIFTSNSACDDHKVYSPNGNIARCIDPETLGMEPRERRGLPVWTRPTVVEIA